MATDKAARQKPAREKPAREKSQHERADTETRPDLLGRIAAPLAAINRAPLTSYHVVMVVTALLTVIGLGMVLSSSNVLAFSGGGTPFDIFLRQALFVLIGWVVIFVGMSASAYGKNKTLKVFVHLSFAVPIPILAWTIYLLVRETVFMDDSLSPDSEW